MSDAPPVAVCLDLTPWVRAPTTGVALTAVGSAIALERRAAEGGAVVLRRVSRERGGGVPWLSPWGRLSGRPGEIFHSFELRVPPVVRSRRILTVHDCWTRAPNPYQTPAYQRRQLHKLLTGLRRADAVVTPTAAVRDELAEWQPAVADRIHVVPWGPPLAVPRDDGPAGSDPAVTALLERGVPYLLVVAAIEARKNLPLVARAVQQLRGLELVLVGPTAFYADDVFAALKQSGVRYTHFRDLSSADLTLLYRGAVALALPSWAEGFGLPVVEAMHLGVPVIVSAIPALLEVAGNAGLTVDPATGAGELAGYASRLMADPDFRANQARRSAERGRLFTWDRTADLLLALYRRLAGS